MPDFSKLLKPNPFAGDTGERTAEVAQALAATTQDRALKVHAALDRVFLAVFPHAHPGRDANGEVVEHNRQDDPLEADDGLFQPSFPGYRMAIEVFSDAATTVKVHPGSRPVPVFVREVARTSLSRGSGLLVLNPRTDDVVYFGRNATAALATRTPWMPAWDDERLLQELNTGIKAVVPGAEISVNGTLEGTEVLQLHLRGGEASGPTRAEAELAVGTLASLLEENSYIRARFDAVEIKLR
ncbi:MAG: hypothetical protein SPG61_06990 [Arcanobacterium sp.]|nr:hypothetical protein [Arcanobacterium sp.]